MTTTEFQSESSLWQEVQTCDRTHSFGWGSTQQTQTPLQSMLLGLHFRHWLTSTEQDLLPLLVQRSTKVLLRLGDQYIHTDDAHEGPMDAVPTTQVTGTEAIFTHRWRPDPTDMTDARLLHTTRIGLIDGRDLMLGIDQPDLFVDSGFAPDHLSELVESFRMALTEARTVARQLRPRLPESGAWLLINRASGRVLATGRQAGALLETTEVKLTGREYSSLADSIGKIAVERGIQLENLEIQDQHLTIVTILSERPTPTKSEANPFFSEFFAHMMRNKLSAIVTASSHMGYLADERGQSDECELAAIIQSQAEELDRQIERFRVLLDYDQLQPRTSTLGDMVKNAVGRLREAGLKTEMILPTGQTEVSLDIPSGTGDVLLESIALSQRTGKNASALTRIEVLSGSQPTSIEITTSLADGLPAAQFSSNWDKYSQRLAALMNLNCENSIPDEKTLRTTLTPTTNRR